MANRITRVLREAWAAAAPKARITRLLRETFGAGAPKARVSRELRETLAAATPKARVSRVLREVFATPVPVAFVLPKHAPHRVRPKHAARRHTVTMMERLDAGEASSSGTPVQSPVMIILL